MKSTICTTLVGICFLFRRVGGELWPECFPETDPSKTYTGPEFKSMSSPRPLFCGRAWQNSTHRSSPQQKGVCAMRLKTIFALTAVLALPTTLSAAGLDNFYGVNMAACVPTGQTSARSVLFNSAGDASFRDGGFGEIILTCAIPNTLSRITKMTVRYKDDGVPGAGSQVVTALRQKRYVFNGISEGVDSAPSTIVEADSNAFVPPVISPQGYRDHQKNVLPTNGTLTFDHRRFFYYIQVNMRRPAGTTGPVTVAYVTLF
jgi:hypothetical protein